VGQSVNSFATVQVLSMLGERRGGIFYSLTPLFVSFGPTFKLKPNWSIGQKNDINNYVQYKTIQDYLGMPMRSNSELDEG
jgi:hypothetical protein